MSSEKDLMHRKCYHYYHLKYRFCIEKTILTPFAVTTSVKDLMHRKCYHYCQLKNQQSSEILDFIFNPIKTASLLKNI